MALVEMLSLVALFQLTGFRNGKQVFVLPHSRWEESPEASWISSGSLGTLPLPLLFLDILRPPLVMLLISLAFRLACSWEMSTAQERRSTKNKVLGFAASQFTLCEQLQAMLRCQSCLPQEEGACRPSRILPLPISFPWATVRFSISTACCLQPEAPPHWMHLSPSHDWGC